MKSANEKKNPQTRNKVPVKQKQQQYCLPLPDSQPNSATQVQTEHCYSIPCQIPLPLPRILFSIHSPPGLPHKEIFNVVIIDKHRCQSHCPHTEGPGKFFFSDKYKLGKELMRIWSKDFRMLHGYLNRHMEFLNFGEQLKHAVFNVFKKILVASNPTSN